MDGFTEPEQRIAEALADAVGTLKRTRQTLGKILQGATATIDAAAVERIGISVAKAEVRAETALRFARQEAEARAEAG